MTIAALIRLISSLIDVVLEGREVAGRYQRLSRMSNSELAGLGLTRSDVPQAAVNGFAGH